MARILKYKNESTRPDKKLKKQFLGVHMDRPIFDFLCLYCASEGISKSKAIREILQEWFTDMEPLTEEFIEKVVHHVQHEWNVAKTINRLESSEKLDWEEFASVIKMDLKHLGISEKIISHVLKSIKL